MPGRGVRVVVGGRRMTSAQYMRQRRKMLRKQVPKRGSKNPLVRLIQRVVNRQEETKYVANAYDATNNVLPTIWYSNGSLPAVGNFYPAIPKLGQGNDDFQRVGSKVEPKSCSVSLRIGFNPTDLSANELLGVIYYGTDRAGKSWAGGNPLSTAAILDNGDGTNVTFSGSRYALTQPLDKKLVTARRIVFRLSKSGGIQNGDNGGIATPQGALSTSNGMSEKSFLLRFKAPKHLTYLLTGDTYPQNYAPWYAVGFCHADGSPLTAADRTLVNVNAKCHMWYKDA